MKGIKENKKHKEEGSKYFKHASHKSSESHPLWDEDRSGDNLNDEIDEITYENQTDEGTDVEYDPDGTKHQRPNLEKDDRK